MFERVANLKQEYTDKYVIVDETRPELARFKGITGLVKTVNMSGRALVQFDAWANIGWYDIDVDYLTVIPEPLPKVEAKAKAEAPAKAAPAAKAAKAAPAKPAAAKPAAGKPAAAKTPGKMSTADILASLRAGKGAAPAPEAGEAAKPAKPAAPKPAAKPAAAPAAGGKMSTADILAAARAKKGAAPPPEADDAAEAEAAAEPEEAEAEPAPIDEATVAQKVASRGKPAGGPVPTTTAEKIAWCREHDAK